MASDPPAKSWQTRIGEATDALAQSFVESISYDRRLYKHDIAGSIAHATMLAKVGLITDAEREAIAAGLKSIEKDIESDKFSFNISNEDIHMVIEAELIKRIGEPGRKLHTGRSRNEQVSLDIRLFLRASIDTLLGDVTSLLQALLALANKYPDAIIPGYTHLRRAQAVLWPHYLLAYFEMFSRDVERLTQAQARTNALPLGSGALAGSAQ